MTIIDLEWVSSQIAPITFAVFINLLDAVTFGTCFFPIALGDTSSFAIDLFLFSTVVVQVVFLLMSNFQCAVGTSMAENIPFIHTMALSVYSAMGAGKGDYSVEQMFPTIMVTLCASTILNGLLFFLVGYFKQGYVLHYFPRHVILGITLGFGVFLLQTSFQVTTGLAVSLDASFASAVWDMGTNNWMQLLIACAVEGLLRVLPLLKVRDWVGQLTMFAVPVVFFVALWAGGISFDQARDANWLFPLAPKSHWSDMWMYYTLHGVQWDVVAAQTPTILGLAAFTLFLVPIRIPTLASITGDDVEFDAELKAQGMGNLLSGVFGSVHNYLSYANSVFFFNMGGAGVLSQAVIALVTAGLFLVGPEIINYVPRIIAGVIMLHLGFDLISDAVVTSHASLDQLEYTSIIIVGSIVTVFGFVPGVIAGGVSACATFVVQSSKGSNVRGVFSGEVVRSNTSWPASWRDKLEVGLAKHGVYVIQLQGQIFFGNIQRVVKQIRRIIKNAAQSTGDRSRANSATHYDNVDTNNNNLLPEYVVLDCSFISGLDNNAVEGLLKLQTKLQGGPTEGGLGHIVNLTFAGLQPSLQAMFAVHIEEQVKRFGGSVAGIESEQSECSASDLGEECDIEMQAETVTERTSLLAGKTSLQLDGAPTRPPTLSSYGLSPRDASSHGPLEDVLSDELRRPSSISPKTTRRRERRHNRARSADAGRSFKRDQGDSPMQLHCAGRTLGGPGSVSSGSLFHQDVNTALQSVEEDIIDNISNSLVERTLDGPMLDSTAFELALRADMPTATGCKPLLLQIPPEPPLPPRRSPETRLSPRPRHLSYDSIGGTIIDLDMDPEFAPDFVMVSPLKSVPYKASSGSVPAGVPAPHPAQLLPLDIGMHSIVNSVMASPRTSPRKRTASAHLSTARQTSPAATKTKHFFPDEDPLPLPQASPSPEKLEPSEDLSQAIRRMSYSSSCSDCPPYLLEILRSRVLELSSSWTAADIPMLSRLVDHFAKDIRALRVNETLWNAGDEAVSMGLLLSGRLDAVVDDTPCPPMALLVSDRTRRLPGGGGSPLVAGGAMPHVKTLQVILPGTLVGELGLINKGIHSRTIVSTVPSEVAMLTRETLEKIEMDDTVLLCALQKLALHTAGRRSQQLMLFNAGAMGPG